MLVIIRDRVRDLATKGRTRDQIKGGEGDVRLRPSIRPCWMDRRTVGGIDHGGTADRQHRIRRPATAAGSDSPRRPVCRCRSPVTCCDDDQSGNGRKPEVQIVLPRHAIIALMKAADGARRAMTRTLQSVRPDAAAVQRVDHPAIPTTELPTFQVAAQMVEATPGITRLMITLEAKGYISRSQSAGDRRQQLCSLTAAGVKVVDAAIPRVSGYAKSDFSAISAGPRRCN